MRRRTRLDSDRPQFFSSKTTSDQQAGHGRKKREQKKKLYTPDTEACVPYLMTRVQSSVTPNMYVLGVTLDWTRVAGQVRKK